MKETVSLKDNLPLTFFGEPSKTFKLKGWPDIGKSSAYIKSFHIFTRIFILLARTRGCSSSRSESEAFGILYAIAFFRQLMAKEKKEVLFDLESTGYADLAEWIEENFNKKLEDLLASIIRKFGIKFGVREMLGRVRSYDEVVRRSRGLRIGIESDNLDKNILKFIAAANLLEVILGLRDAEVVFVPKNKVVLLKEALWALRQVEGVVINMLELSEGRYYFYDEYKLKRIARDKGLKLGLTVQGLEHLIKLDIAKKKGLFIEIAKSKRPKTKEVMAVSKSIILKEFHQKFVRWDKALCIWRANKIARKVFELERPKIEAIYMATINREKILKSQLETEAENHLIFNRHVPIIIIDDSEESILSANKKTLEYLRGKYQIDLIHITLEDRKKEYLGYAAALRNTYQEAFDKGFLTLSLKTMLEQNKILLDGKIDMSRIEEYLDRNVFNHISGVRNRTVLWAKGENVIMNIDDDAPPETYVLTKSARKKEVARRGTRRKRSLNEMLKEFSLLFGVKISSEEHLYKILARQKNDEKIKALIEKYFGYDPQNSIGFLPRAMEEIKVFEEQLLDDDGWGKKLGVTHQRYQGLMTPLARYILRVSDFVYIKPRIEKKENEFKVMPVNIFSVGRLIGQRVKETDLPVMGKDLRGTMAEPISDPKEVKKIKEKRIAYIPYPFVEDQDTSGVAQFIRYLAMDRKKSINLQHVDQSALILEGVSGFAGDVYVIFNRAILDNEVISPSIGRDLRLEEPPFIVWVKAPMMEGKVTVAYSPIAGGQQRTIEERMYVISHQDYTEVAGTVARTVYENAVRNFYRRLADSSELRGNGYAYERLRALGVAYLEESGSFKLNEKDKAYILAQRTYRVEMLSELGLERGKKALQLKHFLASNDSLAEEVRDIDLVIVQYAVSFGLYDTDGTLKDAYAPNSEDEDYFYRLSVEGANIHWQAVRPDIRISTIKGIKKAIATDWIEVKGRSGIVPVNVWTAGRPLEIEPGKKVILHDLPGEHEEAVVPMIPEKKEGPFLENIHKKITDQVKADGEMMLVWPELVENAVSWKELKK